MRKLILKTYLKITKIELKLAVTDVNRNIFQPNLNNNNLNEVQNSSNTFWDVFSLYN